MILLIYFGFFLSDLDARTLVSMDPGRFLLETP